MKVSITLLGILICIFSNAQTGGISSQSVQLQAGTSIFYNQFQLRYESQSLYTIGQKHHVKLAASAGLFNLSFSTTTKGYAFALQPVYVLGAGNHHLEVSAGVALYYHNKLEKGGISYLGMLPTGFIGYRYQHPEKRMIFKAGTGGMDIIQVGIGVRL